MKVKGYHIWSIAPACLLAVLGSILFYIQISRQQPDIYLHSLLYLQPWGPAIYGHILYFVLLAPASGFSANISAVNTGAIILLTLALLLKFFLLQFFLKRLGSDIPLFRLRKSLPSIIAFLLCIVHPIPFRKEPFMVGYLPGNSWHNSTAILEAPLALLLFYLAIRLLKKYDTRQMVALCIFVLLSNLAKPNFFLIFAPVYLLLLFTMASHSLNRRFWLSTIPIILGTALLIIEYHIVYSAADGEGIGISPFLVWDHITPLKWEYCLLGSFAFPLTYLVLAGPSILKDQLLLFSWLLAFSGVLIFILFYEKGSRIYHANFSWQTVPAMQLLFLSTMIHWLRHMRLKVFQLSNIACLLVFSLHVTAGLVYICKIIKYGNW